MAGVIFALLLCFVSCSSHSEGSSFTSRLDAIDVFISQNSPESAIKALKKLEKKAYSSYERLGIYKRYILLGEKKVAEKVLVKGLKKLSGNPELSAVYGNFLLREGRLEEAFSVSQCLENSDYSSIYAECVLRKALVSLDSKGEVLEEAFSPVKKKSKRTMKASEFLPAKTPEEIKLVFCSDKFVPIYIGAYKGSGDSRWIYNAASVLMRTGDYRDAAELYPQKITTYRESLFWGTVFFDAGLYAQSLSALEASDHLAALDGKGDFSSDIYAQILALESDCCYVEDDDGRSEELRQKLCSMEGGRFVTPLTLINTAMYSKRHEDFEGHYASMEDLVDRFPEYIPGIYGYGQLAVDQLKRPKEDFYSLQLRKAGLKTLEMEKRDRIPTVTVEDVYGKIDLVEGSEKIPKLIVLKDILDHEKHKADKTHKSESDVWKILEKSESENNYPSEIVHYAVSYFVESKMPKEAQGIFEGYMRRKYDFDILKDPSVLELWECEYAAWFACTDGDFARGIELYRFIADRYGQRLPALNSWASNSSVVNTFVNLAVIYESTDYLEEALEMLTMATARTVEGKEKSEILFRMAELSWNTGDSRSAARSLKYALSLDNSNNKARLLLKKIKAEK